MICLGGVARAEPPRPPPPPPDATWTQVGPAPLDTSLPNVVAGEGWSPAAGRVTAIEYDAGLAAKARENLKPWPNVTVLQGDGATLPFDPADVIYVNAGVTRPAESWPVRRRFSR